MEEFIISEFGEKDGKKICDQWNNKLQSLIESYVKEQTENQKKVLTNTILPKIALYQLLLESDQWKNQAEKIMEKYMCQVVGTSMHNQYKKLEKIPFFFAIFTMGFTSKTTKSDLWKCTLVEKDKKKVAVDIHKCLWHDACVDNGCPELCQYFCKCDEVTYGGLRKLTFHRTKTLGTGGEKCDFVYEKKRSK